MKLAKPIFGALILSLLAACATPAPKQEADVVFCTQEAKQCPDGRWVGRSGPTCEFKCGATP